jgi:nucleoside phosphorylase
VAVAAAVIVAGCTDGSGDDPSATTLTTIATGPVAPTELVPGDCVTGLALGVRERVQVTSVEVVDCSRRHDLEVFARFDLEPEDVNAESMAEFPGRARVIRATETGCNAALEATGADRSDIGAIALWPTADSWADGDHAVLCAIYPRGGFTFEGRHFDFELNPLVDGQG